MDRGEILVSGVVRKTGPRQPDEHVQEEYVEAQQDDSSQHEEYVVGVVDENLE